MRDNLHQWAIRNAIPHQALSELLALFGVTPSEPTGLLAAAPHSEAFVQGLVRLEASRKGLKLWRNNVGALVDERGIPVRYGLANESARINAMVKSGDLIGWRPITVTMEMVGARIAQFTSRECKRSDWKYSGTEHELAQLRWIEAVNADGGDAAFCNGEGTL